MTVTTVFSETNDGQITSSDATYANALAGTGLGFGASTNTTGIRIGQEDIAGESFVDLGYLSFDTSSISDTDTVSSIVLSVYITTDSSTVDFTLRAREHDWGATLTTADWLVPATLSGKTLLASISTAGISINAYNDLTSQAAFLTATNLKTGTVYTVLGSSRFESSTGPPAGGSPEAITISSADVSGTSQDPKLVITHLPPHTGTISATFPFLDAVATGTIGSQPFRTAPNRFIRVTSRLRF